MDLTWVTPTNCAIVALTVCVAAIVACSLRRMATKDDRRRSATPLTSSKRDGAVVMATSLSDGPTEALTDSKRSSHAVVKSYDGMLEHGGADSSGRPTARALECGVGSACSSGARITTRQSSSIYCRIATKALDPADQTDFDEVDQTFVPDSVVDSSVSDILPSAMSAVAELREVRAQLALERDRRAVAEDWSAFLASTLRAFLAARETYDSRPLVLSRGGLGIGSSSTDTDDDFPVARVPGNGGGKATSKLKRQFQRQRSSSDEKTSSGGSSQASNGTGSFELNYERWLAKYRAQQNVGRSSSTVMDRGGRIVRQDVVRKPETDDEITDWERTVSYNEAILRLDRLQLGTGSGRRDRQSISDKDQRHHPSNGTGQREVRPALTTTTTTTNQTALNRMTSYGQKNELWPVGRSSEGKQQEHKKKTIENSQENRKLEENNILAVGAIVRSDDSQQRQQRSSPQRQLSKNNNQENIRFEKRDEETTCGANFAAADLVPDCSNVLAASLKQSSDRQSNLTRSASLRNVNERAAVFSGDDTHTVATGHLMTSVSLNESDDQDPDIWKLSVRDRVDSWRRKKASVTSLAAQLEQRRTVTSDDRAHNHDNSTMSTKSSKDGTRLGSSAQDEEPSAVDALPESTSMVHMDGLSTVAAPAASSGARPTLVTDNSTSGASTSLKSLIDVTTTTSGGDDVILFEPVAKVGDARALFERMHRQTTMTS